MKRCPDCRRDYYDDTLSFCLEDGVPLVQGAVSAPEGALDEPATAILHETSDAGEGATQAQIHTTEQTAIFPGGDGNTASQIRGFDKRLLGLPLVLVIIVLGS